MARLLSKFIDHPASVGETYLVHMAVAASFGGRMMLAGMACFLHALLPFACERTASRQIALLHDQMVVSRIRRTPGAAAHAKSSSQAMKRGRTG
ncbi:MAG TPA: DUF6356 family protein [Caulobacteraceae bacterium]|nr:DUF6356 family protein [Caulobacteraceae bacterium]